MSWPIRFVPGSKPGIKRKAPQEKNTVIDKKKYEENRVREFKEEWQRERDWLKYSVEKGMTCSICIEVGQTRSFPKSTFTSGSKNFRFSTVADHETSSVHLKSLEITKSRLAAENRETVAHKSVISMNNSVRNQIINKFRNIHALIKYNRPISDFIWLNKLDEAKGISHGNTYNNQKAATTFLENISACEKEKLEKMMDVVKFFSLTMDGSTDGSTTEQETIFIRFSVHGKITTRFLCIGEPESTSSLDLFKFVERMMNENGLNDHRHVQKFIGFGSDGASNMTGVKNGLVARLKEGHPELIGVHCIAHRLELAFRDVFKKDKMYTQLSTLLLGLFYFYKNSSKQRKSLRECIKVLDINGTLPHKINSTRWLPHMKRALENLFRTFPAFLSQLQNASHVNPKAEGLAKMLCNLQILAFASILEDIVKPLARLSLMFQRKDLTLADARDAISSTKDVLNLFELSKSQRTMQILETKQFLGYSLKGNGKMDMEKKASEIVGGIIKQMDLRYKDDNEELFSSTLIASFRNWPTVNESVD
ncbi:zinc finger protein 862-like [Saccostrea cucullata]|uniref:zinc finger protein 862-like n=1 Tax=Saccostrea cuccullata TaxID=36930 RepID=UPI002ED6AA85